MRILLVDDHPLFLDGLKNLLTGQGVEVVGKARDGLEALEKARSLAPDIILMDIQMPRCDGLTATRLIKAERPETRIVMLTTSEDDENLFAAIKSGACGYLIKTVDTDDFYVLLEGVARGEAAFSPGLALRLLEEFALQGPEGRETNATAADKPARSPRHGLTARQYEILTLVSQGLMYKEVAAHLGLAEATIKYHMGEIVNQLHLENRAQVLEYARRTGLLRS